MTKYSELSDRLDLIAQAFSEVAPSAMSDCRKAAAALLWALLALVLLVWTVPVVFFGREYFKVLRRAK